MGLLSSIKTSGFSRKDIGSSAFLAGVNITSLKAKATEVLSGKPAGFISEKSWGSIGSFFFTTYKLPRNIRMSEADEYIEYATLSDFKEAEFKRQSNRTLSFSFLMKQRDTNSEQQAEENLFEEDLMKMIDLIFAEKNKRIPLDFFLYSGRLYLGSYRIDSIDSDIIELDSNGYPESVEISLNLTKYPKSQEPVFLADKQLLKFKNI